MTELLSEGLGYQFTNRDLALMALTHPSYGADHHTPHYQRLEFLGDAVLELTISDFLYRQMPHIDEGRLTRIRASLVREETLCRAARRIQLGKYIRLSIGEERTGGRDKPSILSDVMEALFAAVYLDGGFDAAVAVVQRCLADELTEEAFEDHLDAKSKLQEALQKTGRMPEYRFVKLEGPPHAPVFTFEVWMDNQVIGRGEGTSKQRAQEAAAREALRRMGA